MNWIQRFLTAIDTHKADVDAHHAQVHSVGQHTDVTRWLFLPAPEGHLEAGTRAFYLNYCVVYGFTNNDEPDIYFTMKVPDDFVSFTSFQAIWMSPAAGGNMYWQLQATYAACGESNSAHSDAPALGVTATGGSNIINCLEPANPLTLVNLALGDFMGIHFYRNGSHANDTLNAMTYLLGLLFTYVGHQ